MLPDDVTCTQCVIQWKYIAGNNWGICKNGTGAVGCGPQEEFRACADVAIEDASGGADETPYEEVTEENIIPDSDESNNCLLYTSYELTADTSVCIEQEICRVSTQR